MSNPNDILSSFVEQTYGSFEKARNADKLADLNPNSTYEHDDYFDDRGNPQELEKKADDELRTQIGGRILMQPSIKEHMAIPSQLQNEQLNATTKVHPKLKNYDHSLEVHRGHKLGLIKLRDMPTGSVDELYDGMFDDDSNLVN